MDFLHNLLGKKQPSDTPIETAVGTHMTDTKGVVMVYVPTGEFIMGSNDYDDEKPPHKVSIAQGFWLDLTPVTNEMYGHFVIDGGYKTREFWTEAGWNWAQAHKSAGLFDIPGFTDTQQPRVGVTWFEAYAYCQWRGGRFPTEAEWEWAARGPKNLIFPWGNTFDANRVVYNKNSSGKTVTVGTDIRRAGASWVGALDMSGNVWEWVSSLYRPYPYNAGDGRENNDETNSERVVRGGSWFMPEPALRGASRVGANPSDMVLTNSVRCARSC